MDKVSVEAAMQQCCDAINVADIPGRRGKARYLSGGISAEYEQGRSNVSVSVDLLFEHADGRRKLKGIVKVSCNATQLSVEAARDFVALYQRVQSLAQTVQGYLDSIEISAA
jgi:hypothetical protein